VRKESRRGSPDERYRWGEFDGRERTGEVSERVACQRRRATEVDDEGKKSRLERESATGGGTSGSRCFGQSIRQQNGRTC
jgi:hypothetical protein